MCVSELGAQYQLRDHEHNSNVSRETLSLNSVNQLMRLKVAIAVCSSPTFRSRSSSQAAFHSVVSSSSSRRPLPFQRKALPPFWIIDSASLSVGASFMVAREVNPSYSRAPPVSSTSASRR